MFGFSRNALALFIGGYGLHALALFAIDGRIAIDLPISALTAVALIGLLAALLAIWLELRRLDEVQQRFALSACAISFAGTATLSYAANLPGCPLILANNSLWAIALAIWLISYGVFQWRAR